MARATAADSEAIQEANWQGSIPVVLTLSSDSLSSPTLPPPHHILVARHTFLHLALEEAVRKLHEFAPPLFFTNGILRKEEPDPGASCDEGDNDQETAKAEAKSTDTTNKANEDNPQQQQSAATPTQPYPICWFEDEDTQTALRWHLFAGVLYDMVTCSQRQRRATTTIANATSSSSSTVPWKILLHFSSYPDTQILPLDRSTPVVEQVRQSFKNSLKQALCTETGNSKAAMNITKENHGRLWEAVTRNKYGLYRTVLHSSLSKHATTRIPIRLIVAGSGLPTIQRPAPVSVSSSANDSSSHQTLTLGTYLATEASAQFLSGDKPKDEAVDWTVAGIRRPPLQAPLLQLWQDLRHPDHFLHIIVSTA